MSFSGFKTTRKGRALIAKVLAEKKLTISRVHAGAGVCQNGDDIYDMEDLIDPRMQGTSTEPVYDVETMTMQAHFRSDLYGGVEEGFWLSEFGIFAIDPDEGEVLMYYYSLGDEPQHMNGKNSKTQSVLYYPVSVTIGEDMDVISLGYPASAFIMHKDLIAHNEDPEAHADLLAGITGGAILSATMPENFPIGSVWWKTPALENTQPETDDTEDPEGLDPPVLSPEGKEVVALDLTSETMPLNVVLDGSMLGIANAEEQPSNDEKSSIFKINRI